MSVEVVDGEGKHTSVVCGARDLNYQSRRIVMHHAFTVFFLKQNCNGERWRKRRVCFQVSDQSSIPNIL